MIRPNENALTPESLATDGNQGESAKTLGPCEVEHSLQEAPARVRALSAIHAAREHLAQYAQATDSPALGMVEAADLLDAAAQYLAAVAPAHAPQCAPAGDP